MRNKFGFRLRFVLSKGERIKHEDKSIVIALPPEGKTVVLKAIGASKIEDTEDLALVGSGFPSEEAALRCGTRLKHSLMVLGAKLRRGIDVGRDKSKAKVGQVVKQEARRRGLNIVDDIHGLISYSEELPTSFIRVGSPTLIVSRDAGEFIDELGRLFGLNFKLSGKQTLALEMYSMAHFESSLRARFVTLISAVEALSSRKRRSEIEVKYLRNLIRQLKASSIETPKKKSLIHALENLKYESISKTCRKLVEKHLGKKAMTQFQEFYDSRSKILHDGKIPEGTELGNSVGILDKIVSDLLVSDIL